MTFLPFGTADVANVSSAIAINQLTSVVIAAANPDRNYFNITMDCDVTSVCVWVKLQPAAADDDQKGILLFREFDGNDNIAEMSWEMPTTAIYKGEISAITQGFDINVYVTEY